MNNSEGLQKEAEETATSKLILYTEVYNQMLELLKRMDEVVEKRDPFAFVLTRNSEGHKQIKQILADADCVGKVNSK